jgi:uncharacterized protein (TIGR02246 family)
MFGSLSTLGLTRHHAPFGTIQHLSNTGKALIDLRRHRVASRMSNNSPRYSRVTDPAVNADIDALAASWERGWNRHDAASLAALVDVDVDFVNVSGRWLEGRREFHDWHRFIHETHLSASSWRNRAFRVRQLGAALSLVHLEWTIDNERRVDRTLPTNRSGIFTWIVVCQDNGPRILAAQNTNLAAATSHRLSRVPLHPAEGDVQ